MTKNQLLITLLAIIAFFACNNTDTKNTSSTQQQKDTISKIKDTANYTSIKWLNTDKKFGTKKEGDVLEIVFDFENIGNKPLVFQSVKPSCGCTIVQYPKEAFQPKRKGKIIAKYDSKNRGKGFIRKSIVVTGNFKENFYELHFEGTIK